MARFFPLEVADIRHETRDAVVLTLMPREEDRAAFDFTQGQYLTFRRSFDGEELRRSYSICVGKDEGVLKVGIKRDDTGRNTLENDLHVAPPRFQFGCGPLKSRRHVVEHTDEHPELVTGFNIHAVRKVTC